MTRMKTYLTDIQFDNLELELSALDLHYLDVKTEAVKLLDEIRVISRPHGLGEIKPDALLNEMTRFRSRR